MIVDKPQFDTEKIKPGCVIKVIPNKYTDLWTAWNPGNTSREVSKPGIVTQVKPLSIHVICLGKHGEKESLIIDIRHVVEKKIELALIADERGNPIHD